MVDRAVVFEVNQLGLESTPGTSVAADKLMQAMHVALAPAAEVETYGPMGQKYDTLSILNREWSAGAVTGKPTYTEIVYPLSSVLTTAVITTPGGGTLSRDWTWTPSSTAADTPKTFTIEQGQAGSGLAEKATYLIFTELGLSFSRTGGVEMTGSAIARAIATGQTLTGSPTAIALVPIAPGQVSVYVDDTSAALGTTKLLRDFVAEFTIGDRFNPVWPLNAALTSFDATVEAKPTATLKLTLGNDTAGQAFLATMRTGASKFVRIEAIGALIEGAIPYKLRIDCHCLVADAPDKGDVEGLSTLEWTFRVAHNAAWGRALQVVVTNALTGL
ncbi:MAG TPA: hypothetical protein VG370_35000 [Chloroflexota bacterium]|jgi:hypothetical protein|nr:hypothetical protein [Chloroflexota bacterium]